LTPTDDTDVEGNETVNFDLQNVSANAVIGAQSTHTATITDDDSASVAFALASSATVDESTALNIDVTLLLTSGSLGQAVTVDVVDLLTGTATSATDYAAFGTQTVTFPIGSVDGATQTVTLTPTDDTDVEGNETVNFDLQNVSANALIGAQSTHTATITDDDQASVAFALASSATVDESTALNITVALTLASGSLGQAVTVDVVDLLTGSATAATDYAAFGTQTVTFPIGSVDGATQTVTLTPTDDTDVEGNETVNFDLQNVSANAVFGAQSTHTATITDDEFATVAFSLASSPTADESTALNIDVILSLNSGSLGAPVTVDVVDLLSGSATSATDYTAFGTQTVTFPIGSTDGATQTVTLTPTDDTDVEGNETVNFDLQNVSANAVIGAQSTHTATITDDDSASVAFALASSATVDESTALNIDVTLSLTSGSLGQAVTVDVVDLLTGSATAATDYAAFGTQTVTFPIGSVDGATQTVTLTPTDDTDVEGNETVNFDLQNVSANAVIGAQSTHTATITDDDQATVAFALASSSTVDESTALNIAVTLSLTSGSLGQAVTVDVVDLLTGTATSATDYAAFGTQTVTFPLGSVDGATQTVTLTPIDDPDVEGNETVNFDLQNVSAIAVIGVQSTHTAAITNDDVLPEVNWTAVSQAGAENIGTMTVTAQLSVVSGLDVTVPFTVAGTASNPPDYTITGSPITIPAGSLTADITINVVNDGMDENDETVIISMGVPVNATAGITSIHTATINDDDAPPTVSYTIPGQSEAENNSTMTVTAQLSNVSGLDVTVPFSIGGSAGNTIDYTITVSPSVISAGTNSTDITISIIDDAIAEGNEDVVVTMGVPINANPGAITMHTGTILDDDVVDVIVTESGGSTDLAEGGPTDIYTVVLNSEPVNNVTINVSPDSQSTVNPVSLIFTPADWNMTQSVTVTAVDDAVTEGAHTSTITHSAVSADSGYDSFPVSSVVANIIDNDFIGIADPMRSTVVADPLIVIADGVSPSTVTTTLQDALNQPVSGKTISLSSDRGGIDNFTQPGLPTDANGVAVGTIRSSTVGAATITATDTTDGIVLAMTPQVYFTQGEVLQLSKTVNTDEAEVGDVLIYNVEVRNTTTRDVVAVKLEDRIPPNFKYRKGSARMDGARISDPAGNRPLIFDIGTVPALVDSNGNGIADSGEPGYLSLSYQLIVGSGATPGDYENRAIAKDVCDQCSISNIASAKVTIELDPVFDLGTIIGKIFEDKDYDGWQDEGEEGIGGVMVVLDNGTYAITDDYGRYHFPVVEPGHRLVKVNLNTVPGVSETTTDEALVVSVTPGLLAKANFGIAERYDSETIGRPRRLGLLMKSDGDEHPVHVMGSAKTLSVLVNGQMATVPKGDVKLLVESLDEVVVVRGNNAVEPVEFQIAADHPEKVSTWQLLIMDSSGEAIRSLSGDGAPPDRIVWDCKTSSGQMVEAGELYQYQLNLNYSDGTVSRSARRIFGINRISAISLHLTGKAFETGSAELSPDARKVLEETAEVLNKFPDEKIVIEGHTDSIGTQKRNLSLSRRRAESALAYLIEEKQVPRDRFILRWKGEANPLASNAIPEGRELNRRVEIKGEVQEVNRAKLLDRYRREPVVKINEAGIDVDENGRFISEVRPSETGQLDVELISEDGCSSRTVISVPELQVIQPKGEIRMAYGDKGVRHLASAGGDGGEIDPSQHVIEYEFIARTAPQNIVEFDGEQLSVDTDGTFRKLLRLGLGRNAYALIIRGEKEFTRIANVSINVLDRDSEGEFIVAVEPIPDLTVKFPPKGVRLSSQRLTLFGQTGSENRIEVNGLEVEVKPDGDFDCNIALEPGMNQIVVEVTDPEGYGGRLEREVEYTNTQLFFMAFADGVIGQLKANDFIEGAGQSDDSDFFTEGRVAYYLKGVIKGKYLITSAFDTGRREFDELFRDLDEDDNEKFLTNLDPDKMYPVYGDSSTVVYDTESQGKFYLAVESDELDVLVGNYQMSLSGTELAAYRRTLYGGRVAYRSVATSKYGQPDTEIVVFGAELRQDHVHDELRATGGSLYYLSHRDVIEGSEQVSLVVRDKITGLQHSRIPQVQNRDYTVKYDEGRIVFNRPISSVAEDNALIDRELLSGNPVFIHVDYEARMDSFEKTASGARVRKQLGDHVSIGGTYVKDELSAGEYDLKGIDTEIRFGKHSRVVGEYASAEGTDSVSFISDDGGLTYNEVTPTGMEEGNAWKVAAEVDLGEWWGAPDRAKVGGYYKKLEPGFQSNGNLLEAGTEKTGVNMNVRLTDRDQVRSRYDKEERDATPTIGKETSTTTTVQYDHEHGWWGVTSEFQSSEIDDGLTGQTDKSSLGAVGVRLKLADRLTTELEHQQTFSGTDNDQTSLGVEYQLNSSLALKAKGTTGTLGDSAQGGIVYTADGRRIYLEKRVDEGQAGRVSSTVIGTETPLGPSSKFYSEYQWERSGQGDIARSVTGAQRAWDITPGIKLRLAGEYTTIVADPSNSNRYTIAAGASYENPKGIKFSTQQEIRRDEGDPERSQFVTSNYLEVRMTPDFTFLGKYRYSQTDDKDLDQVEAEFEEISVGLAYRPVKHDRFNALARYTRLTDLAPLDQDDTQILETKKDVASIEWSLDFNKYVEWVEKAAYKVKVTETNDGDSVTTHTYLLLNRLNLNLYKHFDLGLEYRILSQDETDDMRQGWLTELMWNANKYSRIGIGYNFTDFSDNEFSENDYSVHGWFFRVQGKY
jgi:outer membrane protein OmpA-like peptidoglycan-associated protein/IMP cyclohydrolase